MFDVAELLQVALSLFPGLNPVDLPATGSRGRRDHNPARRVLQSAIRLWVPALSIVECA